MTRQTYLVRKCGRYHFRRRLPLAANRLGAITISLNTAEPAEARRLARRLAAKWDETTMFMGGKFERQTLSVEERRQLFRKALEQELALATAPVWKAPAHPSTHKVLAAAYEIVQRVPPDANSLPADDLNAVLDDSWTVEERALLVNTLKLVITPNSVSWAMAADALSEIGAPVCQSTLDEARCTLFRARIEAQRRAELLSVPPLANMGDAAHYLLDDALVAEVRGSLSPHQLTSDPRFTRPAGEAAEVSAARSGLFAETTTVRFSEQLDALETTLFEIREWQPDDGKTRLILEGFAWLTGDKVMSDYRPVDITTYVQRLKKIPKDFVWGKLGESGGMADPFNPADFAKTPPVEKRRSGRTINSHLTKMAAASDILKKSYWLPAAGYGRVMEFDERVKVDEDPSDPKRVPWTPEHLRILYGLPLWQGSGGPNARVKAASNPVIYQDAAYWVPLIVTYTGLAREEACGLEVIDFNFECAVPYLIVQANMTRSKDGETKAGLKRLSRYRVMPLHPELLRLRLDRYVAAIQAEGHEMIFPELYEPEAKAGKAGATRPAKGGRRFYATAWCFIMDATHAMMPLPETKDGKKADLHSHRTYNNSVLASPEVSETIIADHMGHRRKGTGARNYNRRALTLGQATELRERLDVVLKQMPVVTDHVPVAERLHLMHISKRSRVGSAEGRNAKDRFCA